jgi:hypothetical protein
VSSAEPRRERAVPFLPVNKTRVSQIAHTEMKINSPLGSTPFPNFTNRQSRENREERRGDPRGGA